MAEPRLISLVGLGFGDCGKGLFTDALCRRLPVGAVVRYNGGAQAGHNVITPEGKHHTFSQFSSGMFLPGVVSVLASPFILHPTALLVEYQHLLHKGLHKALDHLLIDAHCRINTPFHQAAGRLREIARGSSAHGSCGVGVGETVKYALDHTGQTLTYADLNYPALAREKLETIRHHYLNEFSAQDDGNHPATATEYRILRSSEITQRWLDKTRLLVKHCPPTPSEKIAEQLAKTECILFEGAQGTLLDEWQGFHPHTTWSSPLPAQAEQVAANYALTSRFCHLGILRTYLTRHGQGPLPTHDPHLDNLPELHNSDQGWQGIFRRGYPDAVLLRYALDIADNIDALLISHLDVFQYLDALKWCEGYKFKGKKPEYASLVPANSTYLDRLPLASGQDLAHQAALTSLLENSLPIYASRAITSAQDFIQYVTNLSGKKVLLGSYGSCSSNIKVIDNAMNFI